MGYQYVGVNALGFELHGYQETEHGEERRDFPHVDGSYTYLICLKT